jgi:hypothetical protein
MLNKERRLKMPTELTDHDKRLLLHGMIAAARLLMTRVAAPVMSLSDLAVMISTWADMLAVGWGIDHDLSGLEAAIDEIDKVPLPDGLFDDPEIATRPEHNN